MRPSLINRNFNNYILVLLTILLSGSVFFYNSKVLLIISTFYALIVFIARKKKLDRGFIKYVFFIIILFCVQVVVLDFLSYASFAGLMLIVFYPYLTLKSVGINYLGLYVRIIYSFTIIGFVFFIPSFLSPGIHSLVGEIPQILGTDPENQQNFILYTWEPKNEIFLRNSGPFWEPGAYCGFLTIAIIFETLKNKKILSKRNVVFFFAILTTFSTGGYVTLMFFLILYLIFQKRTIYKYLLLPVLLLIAWYAYFNLEFMSDKVKQNVEYSSNLDELANGRGRFTSALLDLEDIKNYPISGRGRSEVTRFKNQGEEFFFENHRTNGLTDYAVRYGLVGFAIYFIMMFYSFVGLSIYYKNSKSFAIIFVITILTAGFSQGFLQLPTFVCLIYLGFISKKSLAKIEISNNNSNL